MLHDGSPDYAKRRLITEGILWFSISTIETNICSVIKTRIAYKLQLVIYTFEHCPIVLC